MLHFGVASSKAKVESMYLDITDILKQWEYDPENPARIQKLRDGREVLQLRQPFGIEQYELQGRPDGKRPFNKSSVLEEFLDRLEKHKKTHSTDEGFRLRHSDFLLLQNEGILYYSRYLILFQLEEYERTARDTTHNLLICDLIDKYLENEDDKNEMLQYLPYIVRINAIAKAKIQERKRLRHSARQILKTAIELINNIQDIDTPTFQVEKKRSIEILKTRLTDLAPEPVVTPLERLQSELERAVEAENYERAAKLRDTIIRYFQKK
jgi:hypothetical protein